VPEACKGESPKFSGEVELRVPTFDEILEMCDDVGVDFQEDGVEIRTKGSNISMLRRMVKNAEKYYVSVSLKKLNGKEIKSYEDLQSDYDAHGIIKEIAGKIWRADSLGND